MRPSRNIRAYVLLAAAALFAFSLALTACGGAQTGSSSANRQQLSDSDNTLEFTAEEEIIYEEGIHHAELVFEGYEDEPLTMEIYSHSAPVTAETFCRLVDSGFYDGKPVYWILNEMYLRIGNTQQDDHYLITGEYEESDVKNSNSLKRGVVAMNRSADGQQSDASSLIIFMSDLSFLDTKYAGFAKITENYDVIEELAKRTTASDPTLKIVVDDNGKIIDEAKYPRIQSITMID